MSSIVKSAFLLFGLLQLSSALYLPRATNTTAEPTSVDVLGSLATVRNELLDGPCKEITVIFGRGVSQPGNVGVLVGPAFFNAVTAMLGSSKVAIQGVDYDPTNMDVIVGGSTAGAKEVARLTGIARSKCPDTQVVLSGYSEGAQIIHLAGPLLNATHNLKAVVVFGDIWNNRTIPNCPDHIVKSFCAFGDWVCNFPSFPVLPDAHTSYDKDGPRAAEFVQDRVSL